MGHWEQQYIEITNKIRAILDAAEREKRNLTDEESQTVDRMFADAEQARKHVEAARRVEEMSRRMEQRALGPRAIAAAPPAQPDARSSFERYVRRGTGGLTLEERALLAGSGGGSYLVPTELYNQIIKDLTANVWLRQRARVIQTASKTDIPVVTGRPTAAYVAEGAATTPSDPSFAQKELRAKKMATIVQVSEELLADSTFDVESELAVLIAEAFADLENAKFINGGGTGEPSGVVDGVTVGPNAATVNTVSADNLLELYYSLPAQYHANAVFAMRAATMLSIAKLKDSQNRYLWMPPFGANEYNTILGRPVLLDENIPAMGANAKSVLFFDPRYYLILDRSELEIQRLEELYIASGLKAFRATRRNDGVFTVADAGRCLKHPAA